MEYEYNVLKIAQRPDAAPFYLLQSPAARLLEWCDVPRKKEGFMAGYQRQLSDRHQEIKDFIERDPKNIIPGAVIVAVGSDAIEVKQTEFSDVVKLKVTVADLDMTARLGRLAQDFYERLNDEEKANADAIAKQMLTANVNEPDEEDEESEAENDDIPPKSYLAMLTAELLVAKQGIDKLPTERRQAVTDYVNGLTKPGLILDGQHRVFGSKNVSEFDVSLPVVLLPGLSVGEQVFHFYVLNNKASPLKPTELRGTISTSLTNHEIDQLYERFKQAGMKAGKAKLTHRANTDTRSPFKGLIDFGLQNSDAFLAENVMFQVIAAFVDLPRKYRMLYAGNTEWAEDAHYDHRLGLFYRFWEAIRDKYLQAWEKGVKASDTEAKAGARQIFLKANMLVLQNLLLDMMVQDQPKKASRNEPSPLSDSDILYK